MELLVQEGGLELMCELLDLPELRFVYIDDNGEDRGELKKGGRDQVVTEGNVAEFVALLSEVTMVNFLIRGRPNSRDQRIA